MGSSSGASSGSSSRIQNSGSEENLEAMIMEQRKRKRMISNRESAKRSRMRKQKHLDDLTAQVAQLRKQNQNIITDLNLTSQHFIAIDAENSILKAQVEELSHRLESLNEIIGFFNASNGVSQVADTFFNPLQMPLFMNHPLMASADIFQDY